MRKHLNDYLFSPLAWLLTIIVFVLFLSVVLFLTPFGVKMLASAADSSLKELTIKGVSGSLLSGLHIDKIVWDDGNSISLDDVDLKIQHFDTNRGRLVAEKVSAGRLNINLENTGVSGDEITSLPDFGLPLNLNAHLIQLDSLQITQNIPDDPQSRSLLFEIKNIKLIKATINDGKLRFRKLLGSPIILDKALELSLTEGKLNMNQPHDLRTQGKVFYDHPQVGKVEGNVELAGTLTNYNFKGLVEHQNESLGKQTVSLLGQGNYKRVHFEEVILNGDHGIVNAKGRMLWDPEVQWSFLVEGKKLTTKNFLKEWPATIDTTFRYNGSYVDKRLENNVKIVSLEGNLREHELKVQGEINHREGVLTTDNLELQLGDNNLSVTGRANEPFNLKWKIDAQNISQILPENMANLKLAGKIKGEGKLKGRINKGNLRVKLQADELAYGEIKQGKESVFLDGNLALIKGRILLNNLKLNIGNNSINTSGQASEPFALNWKINANNLKQISPQIVGSLNGSIELKGTIDKPDINLKITANNLAYKEISQGKETLILKGDLALDNGIVQLKHFSLKSGNNLISASGQASEPFDLNWKVNAKDLRKLSPQLAGKIEGGGYLRGYTAKPEIKVKLTAKNLAFNGIKQGKEAINIDGEVALNNGAIQLKTLVAKSGVNHITASGRATEPFDLKWNISAKNLKQLSPLLAGQINGKGYLKGTVKKPDVKVKLIATNLAFKEIKQGKKSLIIEGDIGLENDVAQLKKLIISSGKNSITASGQASEPFNLTWRVNATDLREISPQLAGTIKGSGYVKGSIKKPRVKLNLSANHLAYKDIKQGKEAININGELGMNKDVIHLKKLTVTNGNNSIIVSGNPTKPFNLSWKADAKNLKQLSPLLTGRIKGNGKIKGTINKPDIKLRLVANNFAYKNIRQGKEALILEGNIGLNKKALHIKALTARSGKNRVSVFGRASEPMNLQVNIDAKNLRQISPDLSGRIKGKADIFGRYNKPTIKTSLRASGLRYQQYKFAQKELSLNAEIQLVNGVPIVKHLVSKVGNNHIKISGKASSPFDLKWDIKSKNLQQLIPGVSGKLVAKGGLKGTIENPIINTSIDGKSLRYKNFKLGAINGNIQTKNGIYRLRADLSNLQVADQKVKRAKLDVNGRINNHTISLFADHEEGKLMFKANGGWLKQRWKGNIQSLSLKDTKAGNWRLQQPTRVVISKNGFSTSKFCVASKQTQSCSKLSWTNSSGLAAQGTLQKTPLSIFKPWLPEGIVLSGSVNGRYDIKQNKGKPVGTINVTFPNSNFSFKNADGEEQILAYKNAKMNAVINDRTIIADAQMEILNRGRLSSKATIKLSPKNGRHTINGTAKFYSPNINWAQRYLPHSRGLRGVFNSEVTFAGLLARPQIKGKANIKNAYLRLPEAGTQLTNININLSSDKPGKAFINGKMLMGKGVLNVTGALDARDIKRWKATVKISGKNIRFMNTNEVKATMTPNITIAITPKIVNIQGKILIPDAYINLKEIPESSVDESEDVFVIGESKPGEQVSALKIQPKVLIELGDKVKINAFGLRAKLSGKVNISHNRKDILSNGSLRVTEGKYQAYGQNLDINNGRLIFNGSPKIIGMDIRATRKVDKFLVGVHLGGNLLNPKSKIFSDPTLPESEALSFLITGHSLSTASGRESVLLMSAVRGLGITGNDSLLHSIGSSLGLDDVNIVTKSDLKKSELSLGKRLGPKLYVRYLVGLFDTAQKIAVEYKINKRLSLEAQTSAEKYGFDFIYEFERD